MNQTCFLGANSRRGFVSLYGGYPGADAFLHIIKGGPGTGKSSFMRRLGAEAEARGLAVQYVLCSGDPDSLDGVYIPALSVAWADGTAPHALEPCGFGVDADYVNLGRFCRTPLAEGDRKKVPELNRRYRALYDAAYRRLAAATAVETGGAEAAGPEEMLAGIDTDAAYIEGPAQRFLRAISCKGELRLLDEAEKLCGTVRRVPGSSLTLLSRELERRRLPAIRCPLPLDASILEAVLLPWAGRAFVTERQLRGLEPALAALREAKALHDELEAVYRPYMDFDALNACAEETVRQVFGE